MTTTEIEFQNINYLIKIFRNIVVTLNYHLKDSLFSICNLFSARDNVKFKIAPYLLLCLISFSAHADYDKTNFVQNEQIQNTVETRGELSTIETLNIGPDATKLLLKIIELSKHLDYIQSPKYVAKLFNAEFLNPDFLYDFEKKEISFSELKIKNNLIKSATYRLAPNANEEKKVIAEFFLLLDRDMVCISNLKMHEIFGTGEIGIPTHTFRPDLLKIEPTATMHSESYGKPETKLGSWAITFSYLSSGCLNYASFHYPLPTHPTSLRQQSKSLQLLRRSPIFEVEFHAQI